MSRALATLFAVLLPGVLAAQTPGSLRIVDAKVDDDKLQWTDCKAVSVQKMIAVEVEKNGKRVIETRTVTENVMVSFVTAAELKTVKATNAAGKAISADKLAELLRDETPIVLTTGPVSEKQRALFKDKTLFVELPPPPQPKPPQPKPAGGPVPVPPAVPVKG